MTASKSCESQHIGVKKRLHCYTHCRCAATQPSDRNLIFCGFIGFKKMGRETLRHLCGVLFVRGGARKMTDEPANMVRQAVLQFLFIAAKGVMMLTNDG